MRLIMERYIYYIREKVLYLIDDFEKALQSQVNGKHLPYFMIVYSYKKGFKASERTEIMEDWSSDGPQVSGSRRVWVLLIMDMCTTLSSTWKACRYRPAGGDA